MAAAQFLCLKNALPSLQMKHRKKNEVMAMFDSVVYLILQENINVLFSINYQPK